MATRIFDLLGSIRPGYEFNVDSLLLYLRANVVGFPLNIYKFSVSQFSYGQSNPTFLVEVKCPGLDLNRYVVRKKPPGKLLESAHAIEREFEVLRALGSHSNVAVPKVFCLCTDPEVIGTPFYVMEYLDGRIFLDPRLPSISPDSRKSIYLAMANVLASIHSVDIDAAGLGKFGKRHDYCKRQIERWRKQYIASTTGHGKPASSPKMFRLIDWLRDNIPLEDSTGASGGLVHGDIKLDNIIFDPLEDRVIGMLDWELCTIGNQMCDVAYSCLNYIVDIGLKAVKNEGFELTGLPEGIPSQPEYLAEYCSKSILPWPQANWKFYVAFSLFRAASIYAGVYSRWIMGNASGGEHAELAGKKANDFVNSAWEFIDRKYVLPNHPPPVSRCMIKQSVDEMGTLDFKEQGNVGPCGKVVQLRKRLIRFMEEHIIPLENEFYKHGSSSKRWMINPKEEKLKVIARREGLWNLWIPVDSADRVRKLLPELGDGGDLLGSGLSNFEYGFLCEIMGRSLWAPQIFNCGPPDTGNMEVLLRYGNKEQLQEWLIPLLEGKIRSGFAMTEPNVASSDATNIECSILREGDFYVINGTKWWTSGAMDPRCRLLIVMGKTNLQASKHKQQSMILVDSNTTGIHIKRPLTVFGFDDAPHGHAEILFENVHVPTHNLLLGEGRGFEIAQGRLGPGRLHHCMRLVGAAERAMQMAVYRAVRRKAFGKRIAEHGSFRSDIAKCRVELEQTRLLVIEAACRLDRDGNVKARGALAMAKVAAPNMALRVLDMAIQVHGAVGLSSDTILSHLWASARALRIADGPDEVHLSTIAKLEFSKAKL